MDREEWMPVPIKWLSGAFEISNLGNVRHAPRPIPSRNVNGYRQVTFKFRGKHLTTRVHRLVAEAFIGSPEPDQIVNHINANRADNRVENLEWTTKKGNAEHTIKMGRWPKGLKHKNAKIDPKIAFERHKLGYSLREIGNMFGASPQAVKALIVRGKRDGRYAMS